MKKNETAVYIIVAALWLLAMFFAFALIGYRTTALCLVAVGCVVLLFHGISKLKRKTTKTLLRTVLIVALIAGFAVFTAAEVNIISNAKTDREPRASYLLVLGAGVNGYEPSLSLINRLDAALSYLEEYPDSVAIVSGGQGAGENMTEAECMRQWLEERGIAPERIIKEEKATTTQENIGFAMDIIRARGDDPGKKLAIVSSEYHLYRAKLIANSCGVEAVGVAGVTTLPVLRLNYFIREAFAVMYFWAFGS